MNADKKVPRFRSA